ncbi:MAG: NUDIX domain-containing protein [Pseudomonadota bacterium]
MLLRRRPATGLLANMLEVPSTAWEPSGGQVNAALKTPPIAADRWTVPTPVIHVFTHFRLELTVLRAVVGKRDELTLWADQDRCVWTHQDDLEGAALPTLMRKALNVGLVSSVAAA